jgi:hypothetical protein
MGGASAPWSILSFYCNDLYDFRISWSFRGFGSRLFRSFGVVFVLLSRARAITRASAATPAMKRIQG